MARRTTTNDLEPLTLLRPDDMIFELACVA